jgi:uncharacterized protein (TIGR03083 family)
VSDREELAAYVETWWQAVGDFLALLEELPEEAWSTPTDLAGWDVRACAAHTAHLEAVLAGDGEETAEIGTPDHVTGAMGAYTEIGVVNRRSTPPAAILAELRDAATRRHEALLADPPTDGAARPAVVFGGVPWDWRTLLRNRPLDVWMHEQDVRRAVGRPGGMDSPAARHTVDYLTEGFGYVLAKRVGAPAGTTAVLDVAGHPAYAVEIGEDGRGRRVTEVPAAPTVALRMDRESFVRLAGGRCAPEPGAVRVEGDQELGERILDRLATTP